MPPIPLVRRVGVLEQKMNNLSELPLRVAGVETQLIALRDDFTALRAEVRAGDEETRRQMRVLHEDAISRIALLQEGVNRINGNHATETKRRRRRGRP